MGYIEFDKNELVNLEYSLSKELVRSNRAGAYASTTIIGCNTRKYHGLLIAPQPAIDGERHALLSTFDETIIQHEKEFNLALHKYPGAHYSPKGHKYIRDLTANPIPRITYRVGGVILTKETLLSQEDDRVLIRYTLVDAHSKTYLRFRPFLAFRNIHQLSKSNVFVDRKYSEIENGIKVRMYQGYSHLNIQFSKKVEYTHVPDWYYNIEYIEEQRRGYDYTEDLYVPGFFELPIKKGESIVISAGTSDINSSGLSKLFTKEENKRIPRDSFYNCLVNSAQQFVVRRGKKTEILAGFPWFGRWGRDTFIALPGLTLEIGDKKTCKDVIDTMVSELKGPLFPNIGSEEGVALNSVDAPLWFFWSLQQYAKHASSPAKIWKDYGQKMKMILTGYRDGTEFNIKMQENGLIYAGEPGKALTWMDAVVYGKPVTPRIGMPVEINALWYNAVMFSLEAAKKANDEAFINEWMQIPEKIEQSFNQLFWTEERGGYLADFVNGDYKDIAVRPNQIIAASLPYSPIDDEKKKKILDIIIKELLTPRGLRTLTPNHPEYKGVYSGNQEERDSAYHQGTVWPWLFGHFAEAYLKIHQKNGVYFIKSLYEGFDDVMREHGIGNISEIYDGDPPHTARGAISQAWSTSELLRVRNLLRNYEPESVK